MKEVSCRDVGEDCDAKFQGDNDDEIIKLAEQHGRDAHGMTNISDEMRQQLRSKIHEMKAA